MWDNLWLRSIRPSVPRGIFMGLGRDVALWEDLGTLTVREDGV